MMKNLDLLKQIAVGIHKLFGNYSEVVIHDFSDLEHSIIHMEGNISGRSIGGAATDLILMQVKQGVIAPDAHNYQTKLPNGRTLKSCTMYLRDEVGNATGAFCINLDITAFQSFHHVLEDFVSSSQDEVHETLLDDIQSTIHKTLLETVRETDSNLPILSRDEKVNLIGRLDDKGIFQVKKSVPILAEELGLSRSTLYNYLNEIRNDKIRNNDDEKE